MHVWYPLLTYFLIAQWIFLSFIGGLVCFSLRYNEVDDYQPKMTELEEAGIWEKLSGKKIPYYNREDMPSYGFGFVYKILKN